MHFHLSIVSNGRKTASDEMKRLDKQLAFAYFEVLSQKFYVEELRTTKNNISIENRPRGMQLQLRSSE